MSGALDLAVAVPQVGELGYRVFGLGVELVLLRQYPRPGAAIVSRRGRCGRFKLVEIEIDPVDLFRYYHDALRWWHAKFPETSAQRRRAPAA